MDFSWKKKGGGEGATPYPYICDNFFLEAPLYTKIYPIFSYHPYYIYLI